MTKLKIENNMIFQFQYNKTIVKKIIIIIYEIIIMVKNFIA